MMIKNKVFEKTSYGFEDLCLLFDCNFHNRKVIRMDFDEAAAIFKYVRNSDGNVLELGRRYAGSTAVILYAMHPNTTNRKFISVDKMLRNDPICEKMFKDPNISSTVELITHDSRTFKTDYKFNLLFIDAYHKWEGIYNDVCNCWPMLNVGYNALFHDANILVRESNRWTNTKKSGEKDINKVCSMLVNQGIAKEIDNIGTVKVLQKVKELDRTWVKTIKEI
jgi:hypothetical protein